MQIYLELTILTVTYGSSLKSFSVLDFIVWLWIIWRSSDLSITHLYWRASPILEHFSLPIEMCIYIDFIIFLINLCVSVRDQCCVPWTASRSYWIQITGGNKLDLGKSDLMSAIRKQFWLKPVHMCLEWSYLQYAAILLGDLCRLCRWRNVLVYLSGSSLNGFVCAWNEFIRSMKACSRWVYWGQEAAVLHLAITGWGLVLHMIAYILHLTSYI